MSSPKYLLKAITSLGQAYSDDFREMEDMEWRQRRMECVIREMRVELEYLADIPAQEGWGEQ